MQITSIDVVLPRRVPPHDLPAALAARRPSYALALGWSCLQPDETGAVDPVAVHQSMLGRTMLDRPVLQQFSDPDDATRLCDCLGFSGAYISDHDSASDMAEACVRSLMGRRSDLAEAGLAAIIYSHATPEEHPNLTPSFRIQTAIGNNRSLPFSVAGNGAASFVSALQVAETFFGMEAGAQSVLVVTADRFLPPVHARIGDFTLFSDAASAMVLEREPSPGGCRLLGSVMTPALVGRFDWTGPVDVAEAEEAIAAATAETIATLLQTHGKDPSDVSALAPQQVSARLTRLILDRVPGLPNPPVSNALAGNFATSAMAIALRQVLADAPAGSLILGWCMDLDGTLAAALFEGT
jgi:3-oxoacyl-[acyl-carrier-protein] synthase-3